jgi:hypothetical protein
MMKKYILLTACLLLTFMSKSQNKQDDDYKNWIVDLSQSQSSFDGIKIDKVELNEQNTVVHMSFRNLGYSITYIEACNTFHLRSKGKKVARFVRAENIPTRNVYKIGFSCADETTSMRIKPGQFIRFRLYFTRIPEYLDKIDVVEYNGMESCEFDVWNLNISRKEPLRTPLIAASKPKIEDKKPIVKNTPKPSTKPTPQPPLIASKSPSSSQPKVENKVIEPLKPSIASAPLVEKREVKVIKEYNINRKVLQLEVWDNDQEDGDVVSVMLNNHWILKGMKVTKNKKKLEIPLEAGNNTLVFHADNMGTAPPNTAAISFWDGQISQTVIMNSDMGKSEAIRFIRN